MPDERTSTPPDEGAAAPPDAGTEPCRTISRRGLLAAATGTMAFSTPVISVPTGAAGGPATDVAGAGDGTVGSDATLRVRVYPGPTPMHARVRDGLTGVLSGWTTAHEESLLAVAGAMERIAEYASSRGVAAIESSVERRAPLGSRFGVSSPLDALTSAETIHDRFREAVQDRGLVDGPCCHLLLWWDALNYDLGYGGVGPTTSHVADEPVEDAYTIVNIGATETWDSRAITRNMAIHETLHTFLPSDIVGEVNDSRCDHDLGTAVETEPGVREVSPMATAYAGPDHFGGGTRWHGTGCGDHDAFARHDGTDDVDEWRYTTELSDATLTAAATYAQRYFVGSTRQ